MNPIILYALIFIAGGCVGSAIYAACVYKNVREIQERAHAVTEDAVKLSNQARELLTDLKRMNQMQPLELDSSTFTSFTDDRDYSGLLDD